MRKAPVWLLAAALLCSAARVSAQQTLVVDTANQQQRFATAFAEIDHWIAQKAFPGAVIAVGQHGRLLAWRAFGRMDYSADAPAMPLDAVFDLASVSKVVATTTSAAILVDRGQLDLDAPVIRYLPEFAGTPGHEKILVRHLLSHSSGLNSARVLWRQASDRAGIMRLVYSLPVEAEPGTQAQYRDYNLILMGEIIQRITGMPLDQFVTENVFAPLRMGDTRYNPPPAWLSRIPPTEIDTMLRHTLVRGVVHDENAFLLGGVAGHAGLFSSARDLATFAQMYLNGGSYADRRILTTATVHSFMQRQPLPPGSTRALGWDTPAPASFPGPLASATAIIHTGFTGTSVYIDPQRDAFIILLTNRVHPTRDNMLISRARPAIHTAVLSTLDEKSQTTQPHPDLSTTLQLVRTGVDGAEALDFVKRIHANDRWGTFAKFQQTAQVLAASLQKIGLSGVQTLTAPADGVTQFGFWTMPLAWDAQRAHLEILAPAVPAAMRVLADYRTEPASLVMWSGSTPRGGIVADVVELSPASIAGLQAIDVKGKFVLADPPLDLAQRGALKAALYQAGAAGLISYATENAGLLDGHYWMNAWGDYGWGFTKAASPLVGFSITPRQGAYLRELLGAGKRVRVKASAQTRYYAGEYPAVTGIIAGTDTTEEVLELAHAYEIGAQDNATGVAGMLEGLATLQRLIAAGSLPRPHRSIRVLVMAEDYGSSAYIATHMDRMRRTVGAINVDTPAGPYEEVGAYSVVMNPDVSRSYQDALLLRVAQDYYAAIPGRQARWSDYRATSDSYLSDPTIGVPTLALSGSSGTSRVHHNSADVLTRVDGRSLRDMSALLATYLYTLASAAARDVGWLAAVTTDRSSDNLLRVTDAALPRITQANSADALGRELYNGLAQVSYNAARDSTALLSLLPLAAPSERDRLRTSSVERALATLVPLARQQSARLSEAATRRAVELGLSHPIQPIAPPPNAARAEAASLIVVRKRFGPVTLDDLPLSERAGFPGFAGQPPPLMLLQWCDGKRTVAEVIRLYELEHGPTNFDFVGYFKFLARHGYVDVYPAATSS